MTPAMITAGAVISQGSGWISFQTAITLWLWKAGLNSSPVWPTRAPPRRPIVRNRAKLKAAPPARPASAVHRGRGLIGVLLSIRVQRPPSAAGRAPPVPAAPRVRPPPPGGTGDRPAGPAGDRPAARGSAPPCLGRSSPPPGPPPHR